jgi:hypothetical protein
LAVMLLGVTKCHQARNKRKEINYEIIFCINR